MQSLCQISANSFSEDSCSFIKVAEVKQMRCTEKCEEKKGKRMVQFLESMTAAVGERSLWARSKLQQTPLWTNLLHQPGSPFSHRRTCSALSQEQKFTQNSASGFHPSSWGDIDISRWAKNNQTQVAKRWLQSPVLAGVLCGEVNLKGRHFSLPLAINSNTEPSGTDAAVHLCHVWQWLMANVGVLHFWFLKTDPPPAQL